MSSQTYLRQCHNWHHTVCVLLHAVDLRHRPDPFEKVLWEGRTVVAHEDVFWTGWNVVHAVLEEALIDALDVFVDRAHFGWPDEFSGEPQPRVLVSFA